MSYLTGARGWEQARITTADAAWQKLKDKEGDTITAEGHGRLLAESVSTGVFYVSLSTLCDTYGDTFGDIDACALISSITSLTSVASRSAERVAKR